ncbi:ATP-binding protein [Kibdelosporangium phytohabitans]|uniref:ATP-binding protein n=1 Tax=Kibdelosporangium phytohabitans TaxID=860235 RepID=UPI0019FB0DCB|nr:AAA family ATPase [Kibdelosporangium phytohabitans]MBE1468926.1 tetratricopeptide (TPR) repeat protein/energy-coupling factor transporter ATP-binding protein EcfA2 [Kibdelosporangium phytohabitans]
MGGVDTAGGQAGALIGRDRQAGLLGDAITRTLDSHGGLVLVTGEPGIGKTTLVTNAAALASRAGAVVVGGSCWEGAGAPGYWPWVQVVRTLRRGMSPAEWAEASAAVGPALRVLLGEARAEETEEFELYDAVTTLLVTVSRDRPVVVALEDLHWADPASVRLLAFVVQHTWFERLLVVATYRDAEMAELEPAMAPLLPKATSLALTGMDTAGVAALIARTTGAEPEPDLVAEIDRRSGGNPFFVEQLARLWQGGTSITAMAPGVDAVIARRLGRLPEAVTDLLTTAAVLGREFAADLLTACVDLEIPQVTGLLTQAASARLIAPAADGRFTFIHDLVRESLSAAAEPDDLRARHAAVVHAAAGTPMLPAERARHAYLAVPHVAPAVAVEHLLAAARDANHRLATEEETAHYRRALDLVKDQPKRWVEIAVELGTARYLAGDAAEGRRFYTDAIALARDRDAPDLLALIAMSLMNVRGMDGVEGMLGEVVHEAHRDLVTGDTTPSLDDAARELIDHAVESARRDNDYDTLKASLQSQLAAFWELGTAESRLRLTEEMTALARDAGDRELELQAASWRIGALLELGDPGYLAEHWSFVAMAEDGDEPLFRHEALVSNCLVATVTGRFDDARAYADAAHELGEQPHLPRMDLRDIQLWSVELLQGRSDRVDELLDAMRTADRLQYRLLRAVATAHRGSDPGVLADLAEATPTSSKKGRFLRWFEPLLLRYHAQAAALSGDPARCAAARAAIAPHIDLWAVTATLIVDGPMVLWAAVLDAAQERWDEAIAGFTAACESAERLRARPWVVEARFRLATTLLARSGPGDADAAAALFDEVAAEAADLGMAHFTTRPAVAVRDAPANVFRVDSGVWTLGFAGRTVHLPDAKGLRDLHVLIGAPGTDIPAVRLLSPEGGEVVVAARGLGGDAVLDDQARAAYQRRLADLDEEIDRAAARGADRRAAELDRERHALIEQLRGAVGLGGRSRRLGDEAERARKAVTNRIRDTLQRLAKRHPELAAHLRASVTTGAHCRYRPDEPVAWSR